MTPTGHAGRLAGKYEAALRAIDQHDIHLMQVLEQDGKLYIHGAALSREARRKITEKLEHVDPNWSREVELNLHAPGELPPHTGQTVVNR